MTSITCVVYDLIDCATPDPHPNDLLTTLRAAVTRLGARVLAELPVQFPHHGITCALVLAESHLVLSTWPEHRLAHIDLSTCRADTTPHHALQPTFQLFQPRAVHSQFIDRTPVHTARQP
jgi:S-adenosylmethionine/arginine decarboxylase-like enzyme